MPEGYRLVLDPLTGVYAKGFNREKTYTFLRVGSDERQVFRLADASPYFNVAGLYYKELPETISDHRS